ncbi:MAG: transcriptional regulator [Prevotella sp.]|nr:transcriptional regulator [Prevotella sp.]
MPFQPLDPLLHSELRLAVISLLISAEEAEFPYIKEQTGATAGNLSVQIEKLSAAGYIEVEKTFKGKKPCTICRITNKGRQALEAYVEALKSYLNLKQ